jgi:hypothetical protein
MAALASALAFGCLVSGLQALEEMKPTPTVTVRQYAAAPTAAPPHARR